MELVVEGKTVDNSAMTIAKQQESAKAELRPEKLAQSDWPMEVQFVATVEVARRCH